MKKTITEITFQIRYQVNGHRYNFYKRVKINPFTTRDQSEKTLAKIAKGLFLRSHNAQCPDYPATVLFAKVHQVWHGSTFTNGSNLFVG